jgi:hypothetical protein
MTVSAKEVTSRTDHDCVFCGKTISANVLCFSHKYILASDDGFIHGRYWAHRRCFRKCYRRSLLMKWCHHPHTYTEYYKNEPHCLRCMICESKVGRW